MLMRLDTPDLKAPEKLLLLILSDFGDELGGSIYPSLKTLSERSCMSRSAVITNLKKLEDKKYIGKIVGGVVDGQNVTNRYFINLEKLGYDYQRKRFLASA